jgi:vanillate O-demethylase monooxygenase subunit
MCGYHGLKVSKDGSAASMPGQNVKNFPCVHHYPTHERYGFIWLWPGDPSKADIGLIPHLPWAESDDWAYGGDLYHIQCDYRLMVDNLMDLTHETYVHSSSIGQKEIDEAPVNTQLKNGEVVTSRFMENIMPPPFWQDALRANDLADDVPVDRWQICRFAPPNQVMIEVGVAHAGYGGYTAPAEYRVNSIVVDFMTPETETSHWYFWGMARNFKPHDNALTDSIREGQGNIFAEDREILESQQRNLLQYPERRLMKLNIDAGGVQARRILSKLIQEEVND